MKRYRSIDASAAWPAIRSIRPLELSAGLDPRSIRERVMDAGGGLSFFFGASDVSDEALGLLYKAAQELELVGQYRALASGELMNQGEGRMVLHHLLRGQPAGPVVKDGRDYRAFYEGERARFSSFASRVRSGELVSPSGAAFSEVVQIGIGGSDLGPRALYLALEQWARERGLLKLRASFISNVDPDDANAVLSTVDARRALFILVSKSGTTQETLANEAMVKALVSRLPGVDPSRQFVAVTSETSPLAKNPGYLDSFYIDDFIGGRYSATSAVGGVVLSLALGPEAFGELLAGACEADALAMRDDPAANAALTDALIGVYERNALGRPSTAVLPYAQALSRFPAHLQQLDMESNGKALRRDGTMSELATGPTVFGEPGTNGQHSFYQLLHQGTDVIPLQFIAFRKNQSAFDPEFEGSTARRKLNANLAAQIVAFAQGKRDENPNKSFPGGRPSTLLVADELDPRSLGALLAHYENKVMFQGFAWNLNSFDQEGVQLGKVLTKQVLAAGGPSDPALAEFARILGAL